MTTQIKPTITSNADIEDVELLIISEASRLMTHNGSPEEPINGILRLMSQMIGLNSGRIALKDEDTDTMSICYSYGLTAPERARGHYVIGEGGTGRVMQTRQVAVVQNIDDEPIYLTRAVERGTLPQETVAFLAVPILYNDTPARRTRCPPATRTQTPFQQGHHPVAGVGHADCTDSEPESTH